MIDEVSFDHLLIIISAWFLFMPFLISLFTQENEKDKVAKVAKEWGKTGKSSLL